MKPLLLLLSFAFYSVFSFAQDCNSVGIAGGNGQINISGLTGAPNIVVQVFNSSWASVFNQTYTNQPGNATVSPLPAGQYFVNVRFHNSAWATICEKTGNATVTSGPAVPADTCGATFSKTFGTAAGDDEAYNIVRASDGNFIAVGHATASGTTNYNALVMKVDSKGTLLWSKTLGGAQHDYFAPAVATSDGGVLAGGRTNATAVAAYSGDAWLVRLDGSGNVLWQKRYFDATSPGTISEIIQTPDGGFAFTGTFPMNPGAADAMVVKIDANGNIQWQKRFGSTSSDNGLGMVYDDHGTPGLVICGVLYPGPGASTYYDAHITKVDMSGNLLWMKRYDLDARLNWAIAVYKVADGLIYNMKHSDNFEDVNATPSVMKTDFNGTILWTKDFTIPNCREGRITPLPDGSIMMVQTEYPFTAASDVYLMRISSAGNIMWTKKYPRAGAQWLWNLTSDGGNHVLGAGFTTSGSYNDVLLSKVDLNGKMGNCSSTSVTPTTRNNNFVDINYTWTTNTTLPLTAGNTAYTPATYTPVENVLCSDICPTVTISSPTVNENAGNAVLQVCIAAPAASTIVYQYTTANGSATSGSDYTGGAGTVTIQQGQTCGTISIPITNDADIESAEDFTVSIGSVTGTVTINDDDQAQGNCSSVAITPGNNMITVTGVTAPVATVQVFNSSWATVFNQTYTNQPGTVNVPIAPGTYLVKVTFYNSGWGYICDKSENVTVVNNCPAGTICVSNLCPTQTVNLYTAYSIPNLPAGTIVTFHTGTPATDANKMTESEAQNVSVSGTYYAAIHITGAGCYSATIPVTVTIVACSSADITKTVQLVSDDQRATATRNIVAFPNPFNSSLRVIIDSEKKEKATISLMDVQGRELRQMPVQLSQGSNTVLLEGLGQFTSGNYFLRISSASGMKTLKLMRQQ